jgi:hypothetical protein
MKTAYLQWITLPVSISCYCFVCTQANSGSVYWKGIQILTIWLISKGLLFFIHPVEHSIDTGHVGRLKPVFHFNRIVPKRSVFLCFLTTRVELMTSTQKKMLRYVTIRLKWKTGLSDDLPNVCFSINLIELHVIPPRFDWFHIKLCMTRASL